MPVVDWSELRREMLGETPKSPLPAKIRIPSLPQALLKFCRKADDPKSSPCDLATIIETDASLTCELLKTVNSTRFALRTKASSAQQALSLLGIRQTKLLLMTGAVRSGLGAKNSALLNIKEFWNTNLERALFAREIALLLKADAEVAFAGSMLQDFLLPLLTHQLESDYTRFPAEAASRGVPLIEWETNTFGWNHALAAAHIMAGWNFPDELVCAVLLHHRGLELLADPMLGRTAAAAVAVASLLPEALGQTAMGDTLLHGLEKVWPAFRLETLAGRVETQFRDQGDADYQLQLAQFCEAALATAG